MSFKAILENKFLAKISSVTVIFEGFIVSFDFLQIL